MNRYRESYIRRQIKIEKRRNEPDVIYFQHYEMPGFFAPKYIFIAFSIDGKKEYKSQSRDDLIEFIHQHLGIIEFMRYATK